MSGPVRIMLVEDNPADVLLLREVLHQQGIEFSLDLYTNGEDAATAIADMPAPPNLIVLDINVPRVDGLELLERIRSNPVMGKGTIAILTSSQAASDRNEAEKLGVDAYIVKPLGYHEFLSHVGGAIKRLLEGTGTSQVSRGRCDHRGWMIASGGNSLVPSFANHPTSAANRSNHRSFLRVANMLSPGKCR